MITEEELLDQINKAETVDDIPDISNCQVELSTLLAWIGKLGVVYDNEKIHKNKSRN